MKGNDIKLLAALLIFGMALLVFNMTNEEPGAKVKVILGQDVYGVYELSEDREIAIGDAGAPAMNIISISNGSVKMKEANCPGGDCVMMRAIDKTGQSIVCLPNKVLISIEGAGDKEIDSIAY